MASSQTTNYSLPQWSKSDRIQMSDFNTAMSTIDAALAKKADTTALNTLGTQLAAVQSAGLKLKTGSYTGTGTYGSSNPTALTFDFVPKLVVVISPTQGFLIWNGGSQISGISCPDFHSLNGKTLRWYYSNASGQMNVSGSVYYYLGIGV